MLKGTELNLPIIKGVLPRPRRLSMDDYLRFVTFNLKYTVDNKAIRKQQKLAVVNVSFSLK